MSELMDAGVERALLAGLFHYGADALADVADLVGTANFTQGIHQVIFSCAEYVLGQSEKTKLDVPSILSAAGALGLGHLLEKPVDLKYLVSIPRMPVEKENLRRFAGKLRKLAVARDLADCHDKAKQSILEITGDEPIEEIVQRSEGPILDYTTGLASTASDEIVPMGKDGLAYVRYLMDNPREMVGIPTGFTRYDRVIGGGIRPGSFNVVAARQKQGKAQPLTAVVMTPSGPKMMGDIKVGDCVCGVDYTVNVVTAIYPQGIKDIYEVKFADGDSTQCCLDHLWEVEHLRSRKKSVLTLKEIMGDLYLWGKVPKWRVRLPGAVFYNYQDTGMNPYLMGVILGDGCTRGYTPDITNADEELLEEVKRGLGRGYGLVKVGKYRHLISKGKTGGEPNLYTQRLREYALCGLTSHYKFIPDEYKYNTVQVRRAVLQGLFDTDGSVSLDGSVTYLTTSIRMAKDVKDIIESLGGTAKIRKRVTTCGGKKFPSYRVWISGDDLSGLFFLSQKRNRCRKRRKSALKRAIKEVVYVGKMPAQCITVSSSDGLYLTNNCIVTHNTHWADNCGLSIAKGGIHVLNVDTEMEREEHMHRVYANMTGLPIWDIEKGKYKDDKVLRSKIEEAARELETIPYDYYCAQGKPFTAVVAGMRRWVLRRVGLGDDGKARPCVVIYDWLKIASPTEISRNLAEHQHLGFIASSLKNFMAQYGVGCICFSQLNRDGIDKEDTSIMRASDRILDFCTSFSIFKQKSVEERAAERGAALKYTHKIVPKLTRHGQLLDEGDYINIETHYDMGRMTEGPTRNELGGVRPRGGFVVEEDE